MQERKKIDIETLKDLYLVQKLPCTEIAKKLKLNESTVRIKLKKAGIYNTKQSKENFSLWLKTHPECTSLTSVSKDELSKLYIEKELSLQDIAKTLNIHVVTVRELLKRHNIYNRSQTIKNGNKKRKETTSNHYGVNNISQLQDTKNKIKQTCLDKYGVTNISKVPETIRKIQDTQYEHFGSWFLQTPEYISKNQITCLDKYGVTNVSKLKDIHNKKIETMHKNKSWNTSKYEEKIFKLLCKKYPNTKRQYTDTRYPFSCDFYIPELDLFIEYNGNFVHGFEPFDSSNSNHLKLLEKWKIKAQYSKYYKNAIYIWTERDPLKLEYLKKLNHWSIYNMNQFLEYYQKL